VSYLNKGANSCPHEYDEENIFVTKKDPNALNNHKNWRNSIQVGDTIDAVKEKIITMAGEKS
jgi:hypothetical protein